MKEKPFANLFQHNIITEKTTTGLLSILPRVPTVTYDDSFCRFVRDSNNIEIDKVLYRFRQGDYDYIAQIASFVDYEFKPDEATKVDVLNIVMMYEIMNCGARMEFKLARMLWTGNPANNAGGDEDYAGFYREFKGFEMQTGHVCSVALKDVNDKLNEELTARNELDDIEFVIVAHPGLIFNLGDKSIKRYRVDDREYRVIFDDSIPEECENGEFESSLYIVPLSPEGAEEPITYLEHADYQRMVVFPSITDDVFWTDNGFYAWILEQEKWDYKLSVKNESRLVLKHPGYVTRFNVKYRLPM